MSVVTMRWTVLVSSVILFSQWCWGKTVPSMKNQLVEDQQTHYLFGYCSDSLSLKTCLKMKSLVILDDLTGKESPIQLLGESLTLVKNKEVPRRMLPVTLKELELGLPKEEASREEVLDNLIGMSLTRFVKSRTLQFRLSDFALSNWTSTDEGRKKKGSGGLGAAFMMAGGMMGALGLAAIAMMAGKAMMVSMMALMLAALSAMKKGGGGGGGHAATTYEVINVPTGHGHHGRSLYGRGLVTGVELAYRAHRPSAETPTSAPDIAESTTLQENIKST